MSQIQTTLPEVLQEEIVRDPQHKFSTKYFEVSATDKQKDKIIDECDKKTKQGMAVYTETEKRKLKMMFIQKKMRCVSVWPLFQGEWAESALALYQAVFSEEFDR